MPPLMRTAKESPRGDVCASQTHGVISPAETISTAVKSRNLHHLTILFVLPFRGRLLDCTTPTESTPDRRSLPGAYDDKVCNALLHGPWRAIEGPDAIFGRHNRTRSVPPRKRLSPNAYLQSSELAHECWPWQRETIATTHPVAALAPARSSLFENPASRDRTARVSACRVLVELIRAHRAPPLNLTVEQPRLTAFFLENIKQLLLSQRLHGIHGIHLRRVPRGKQTSCPGDQRQHHRSHSRAGSGGFSVLHKEASRNFI